MELSIVVVQRIDGPVYVWFHLRLPTATLVKLIAEQLLLHLLNADLRRQNPVVTEKLE